MPLAPWGLVYSSLLDTACHWQKSSGFHHGSAWHGMSHSYQIPQCEITREPLSRPLQDRLHCLNQQRFWFQTFPNGLSVLRTTKKQSIWQPNMQTGWHSFCWIMFAIFHHDRQCLTHSRSKITKANPSTYSPFGKLRKAPYKVPALLPARFNLKSPSVMPASPSREVPWYSQCSLTPPGYSSVLNQSAASPLVQLSVRSSPVQAAPSSAISAWTCFRRRAYSPQLLQLKTWLSLQTWLP